MRFFLFLLLVIASFCVTSCSSNDAYEEPIADMHELNLDLLGDDLHTETIDGIEWKYVYCDGGIEILRADLKGDIKIPSEFDSLPVIAIGNHAFAHCGDLTSIEIPSSVKKIGDDAFRDCYSLKSIEIPFNVSSIGNLTFSRCESLTSVNIPSSVTSIGDRAFRCCSGLKSIEIPESVIFIGYRAFSYCDRLTKISIPKKFVNEVENLGLDDDVEIIVID